MLKRMQQINILLQMKKHTFMFIKCTHTYIYTYKDRLETNERNNPK